MSKQEQKRDNIEETSTDKLLEEIEQNKKILKKSFVFAFVALVAIIVLGIAWFVSNTRVTSTGVNVSAMDDNPFVLASVGGRMSAEKTYLKDDNKQNLFTDGKPTVYENYIDTSTGKQVSTKQTYYIGTNGLAWRLSEQKSFQPGATGKLEFYIIPKKNEVGKSSVEVTIDLEAYELSKNKDKAIKSEDKFLPDLVRGHILLFQSLDNTQGYSGWLYNTESKTNKMTVSAPKGGFQEGVPYKVTFYWIWPKYFRNYVYDARNTYGDLFANIENNTDYNTLLSFVNNNQNKLFYGGTTLSEINNQMTDEVLDHCNKYYNDADEYIGRKQCYIYIEASVQ